MNTPAEPASAAPTHLIVLGASRGGTTLLATALGAHPRIACLDEDLTGAFDLVVGGKIRAVKLCVPNHIELTRRWNSVFAPGLWFGTTRKSLFMNQWPKSRHTLTDLSQLGDVQPIGIVRDPQAVLGAIRRRENRSLKVAAYRWTRCIEVLDELASVATRPPLIVCFDRLVKAPETTLKALSRALAIEFDPAMLDAPQVNHRYPNAGFDTSRTATAGTEAIDLNGLIGKRTLATYQKLVDASVG